MSLKAILIAVFALVLMGAGAAGVLSYRHMAARVAQLEPLKNQVAELQDDYAALTRAIAERDAKVSSIQQHRTVTNKKVEDATKHDPSVSAYLSERIPDGLRDAYTNTPKR